MFSLQTLCGALIIEDSSVYWDWDVMPAWCARLKEARKAHIRIAEREADLWQEDPHPELVKLHCLTYSRKSLVLQMRAGCLEPNDGWKEDPDLLEYLLQYACIYQDVKLMHYLVTCNAAWPEHCMAHIAAMGDVSVMQWAQDSGCPRAEDSCSTAACSGHLDALKWLRSQEPPYHWDGDTCFNALEGGHLNILKWAREQTPPCPWGTGTFALAASLGMREVLEWMLEGVVIEWPNTNDACTGAAAKGKFEVLKWLRSLDPPCPWDSCTAKSALTNNHLDILKWMLTTEDPCPTTTSVYLILAQSGNLEMMEWIRDNTRCRWNATAWSAAAYCGHLHVLKWLREQSPPCPLPPDIVEWAARGNSYDVLKWLLVEYPQLTLTKDAMKVAATNGHVESAKVLMAMGCPHSHKCSIYAANTGRLHMLKYLRSAKEPFAWNSDTFSAACESGDLDTVKWLRSISPPCPISERAVYNAAIYGGIEMLKWIFQQDVPSHFRDYAMRGAVKGKSTYIMKWVSQLHPALPPSTIPCKTAAELNNLAALKWLHAQLPPHPMDDTLCTFAVNHKNLKMLKWLRSLSPPAPWDVVRCMNIADSTGAWDIVKWIDGDCSRRLDEACA